jgi:hypothetical protein
MTYATVEDALNRIKRQFNDTLGEVSPELWYDWLNDFNFACYEVLFKTNPQNFFATTNIAVAGGTSQYALPATFKTIDVPTLGVFELGSSGTPSRDGLPPVAPYSGITGYWIKKGVTSYLNFEPAPAGTKTYQVRYIPEIETLATTADSLVITTENLSAITQWLDKNYGQWVGKTVQELNADERFREQLKRVLTDGTVQARVLVLNRSNARI